MWNKDERDGKAGQAKGRVKQAVGALIGNKKLETEGQADEAEGKVQAVVGEVRRKAGTVIEKAGKIIRR